MPVDNAKAVTASKTVCCFPCLRKVSHDCCHVSSNNGHNRWNKLLEQVANFLIWGTGTLVSVQHNKTIEQVMSKRPGAAENTHQRKMNKKKDKCITALTNKPTHWHAKKKGKMNALLYLASWYLMYHLGRNVLLGNNQLRKSHSRSRLPTGRLFNVQIKKHFPWPQNTYSWFEDLESG